MTKWIKENEQQKRKYKNRKIKEKRSKKYVEKENGQGGMERKEEMCNGSGTEKNVRKSK